MCGSGAVIQSASSSSCSTLPQAVESFGRSPLFPAPLRVHNDGVYVPRNNATGSVWEQLKTLDKMNDELGGDLERLVVLHDIERWKGMPIEKEVEGFRIVKVA